MSAEYSLVLAMLATLTSTFEVSEATGGVRVSFFKS